MILASLRFFLSDGTSPKVPYTEFERFRKSGVYSRYGCTLDRLIDDRPEASGMVPELDFDEPTHRWIELKDHKWGDRPVYFSLSKNLGFIKHTTAKTRSKKSLATVGDKLIPLISVSSPYPSRRHASEFFGVPRDQYDGIGFEDLPSLLNYKLRDGERFDRHTAATFPFLPFAGIIYPGRVAKSMGIDPELFHDGHVLQLEQPASTDEVRRLAKQRMPEILPHLPITGDSVNKVALFGSSRIGDKVKLHELAIPEEERSDSVDRTMRRFLFNYLQEKPDETDLLDRGKRPSVGVHRSQFSDSEFDEFCKAVSDYFLIDDPKRVIFDMDDEHNMADPEFDEFQLSLLRGEFDPRALEKVDPQEADDSLESGQLEDEPEQHSIPWSQRPRVEPGEQERLLQEGIASIRAGLEQLGSVDTKGFSEQYYKDEVESLNGQINDLKQELIKNRSELKSLDKSLRTISDKYKKQVEDLESQLQSAVSALSESQELNSSLSEAAQELQRQVEEGETERTLALQNLESDKRKLEKDVLRYSNLNIKLKETLDTFFDDIDSVSGKYTDMADELSESTEYASLLEDENEELRDQISDLASRLEYYRGMNHDKIEEEVNLVFDNPSGDDWSVLPESVTTNAQLIAYASKTLKGLAFGPDAEGYAEELDKDSRKHKWVKRAWKAFVGMNEYSLRKRSGEISNLNLEVFLSNGSAKHGMSPHMIALEGVSGTSDHQGTRRFKVPEKLVDEYGPTELFFSHIRIDMSNPAPRIHFLDKTGTGGPIIVGYYGRHLPNRMPTSH